jgi:tetraacyldisaccharide 4'-kinase
MKDTFSARRLLLPLIPLYRLALAWRELRLRSGLEPVRRLRFPVVSIGNLSTGGAGKTPLTVALAKALTRRGLRVDVLSRGYGRQSQLAARVNPEGTADEFGDEPLLIARDSGIPVYVAPQRHNAGLLAEADSLQTSSENHQLGATSLRVLCARVGDLKSQQPSVQEENRPPIVHLLDDGFQHRQLARDVDILLLNRDDWQDWLLPAGNLREPLSAARRASIIVIPADDPKLESDLRTWGWQGPVWRLRRTMKIPTVNGPIAAFCGIARPEQFFAGLEAAGLKLTFRQAFPDHHRYTALDLNRLAASARDASATALITTEKDLVRLGALSSAFPESMPLSAVHLRIEIENQDAAINWLVDRLAPASAQP